MAGKLTVVPKTSGFARAMPHVLAYEGGKVDDPRDPGGRTNQGVIQRVYDAWRSRKGLITRDVYDMTEAERDAIYKAQYWDAVQGDKLPAGVNFVVFDGAVNSGPGQSIKWLQRALDVVADGAIGSITIDACNNVTDIEGLVNRICDRRLTFLRSLRTFKTFGRGWTRRVENVRDIGVAWAQGNAAAKPARLLEAHPKAIIEDAHRSPGKGTADAATGGGVGSGALAGTLTGLQEQLTPFSMAGDWIGRLVVALIVISAVLTIGGLVWRWYANRRKAELADALDLQPVSK